MDVDSYIYNQPIEQEDGSYECEEDFYLKLEYHDTEYQNSKATCVDSKDECKGLYMLQNKRVCANYKMCSYTDCLSMYVFNDGNTKLCLTSEECVSKKGFVLSFFTKDTHECFTATQCKNYNKRGMYYYPYSALGLCFYETPDSSVSEKENGYECETGYLYIKLWD